MQTDPTQSLEVQLHDSIPIKEIEIDMEAKTPESSIIPIKLDQPEQVGSQPHVLSEDIISFISSSHVLQSLNPQLNDLLASVSKDIISEVCLKKRAPEINSIQQNDPLNQFKSSIPNSKPLKIQEKQKKYPVIRKEKDWIENGCTDDLTYASFELIKCHKHLMRLQIHKGILMRHFLTILEKNHTQKFLYRNI